MSLPLPPDIEAALRAWTPKKLCKGCGTLLDASSRYVFCEECRDRKRRLGGPSEVPVFDRPFMAWDGEGWDCQYTLLANSAGESIEWDSGLSTEECLDFLLKASPDYNHVWYGFGYDVTMMLKDLPLLALNQKKYARACELRATLDRKEWWKTAVEGSLQELNDWGQTTWEGYRITYIPKKVFAVSVGRKKDGTYRRFSSWDSIGFFQGSFISTLRKWLGEVPDIITEGKAARENFKAWPFPRVKEYNFEECRLLVLVMDKLRESLRDADLPVDAFHGSGAVASVWLQRHGASRFLAYPPEDMRHAVACAYVGGRIEPGGWGLAMPAGHADINSAYPWAMANLCPDLSLLRWIKIEAGMIETDATRWKVCEQGLYHIQWRSRKPNPLWFPFPFRDKRGSVCYPPNGEGWVWGVELASILKHWPRDAWGVDILEAWLPEGPIVLPFRQAIEEAFEQRAKWKSEGNFAQEALKLALNSLYGKTAQTKGWGDKEPPFRSLIWAGLITAGARAKIAEAMAKARFRVALVMTDSIFTFGELPVGLPTGKGLGRWSVDDEIGSVAVAGAGLYQVYRRDQSPVESGFKQRGFGDAEFDFGKIVAEWTRNPERSFETKLRRFVGIGLAIRSAKVYRPHFCEFWEVPRKLRSVPTFGTTKRLPDMIWSRREGSWHWQAPRVVPEGACSAPYGKGLAFEPNEDLDIERLARETEE